MVWPQEQCGFASVALPSWLGLKGVVAVAVAVVDLSVVAVGSEHLFSVAAAAVACPAVPADCSSPPDQNVGA